MKPRIRIRNLNSAPCCAALIWSILLCLQIHPTISLVSTIRRRLSSRFAFTSIPALQRSSYFLATTLSSTQTSYNDPSSSPVDKEPFNTWLSRFLRKEHGSPEYAEGILIEHIQNETAKYDTVSFNMILSAWAKQKNMPAARRADALLTQLLQHPTLKADSYSYSAVINAYAKSGGGKTAALRAEELLHQMTTTWIPCQNDFCHNAVIDSWAVSGDPNAGRRAQRCLEKLQSSKIRPSRITYNGILKAWARSPGGADEALKVLREMERLGGEVVPDKVSYTTVIDAYCKERLPDSIVEAETLLQEMEEKSETHGDDLRPDIFTYSCVLHAYAESVDVSKAMRLKDRMKKFAKQEPNTTFLNTMMHLFAKANQPDAAETLFESMVASSMEDKITYSALISAHANQGNATRALQLLEQLETKFNETGSVDYLPNEKTFGATIRAIANAPVQFDDTRSNLLRWIDDLYHRMDRLALQKAQAQEYLVLYSQMFTSLANTRDRRAARRALLLLDQMQERGIHPNSSIYANLINTLTKSRVSNAAELATHYLEMAENGYDRGNDLLRPTKMLYSACLQSYAKTSSPEGAEAAEKLLQRTKALYQKGRLYAKPTSLYYNAVMDAHARSGCGRAAAVRAEELLRELEDKSGAGDLELRPRTRSYNAAILAWKNSNEPDAPQRAEALLKRMNERYKSGDERCRPDRVTINSIISVWAKSGQENAPKRAEEFLHFMEQLWAQGDQSLRPDRYTYNAVIDAYASSCLKSSARRADELFKRMKELHDSGDKDLMPDIVTFTSLLSAWQKSNEPEAPEKIKQLSHLIYMARRTKKSNSPHTKVST